MISRGADLRRAQNETVTICTYFRSHTEARRPDESGIAAAENERGARRLPDACTMVEAEGS